MNSRLQLQTQGYQLLYSDLWFQGKDHCLVFISFTPCITSFIITVLWFTTSCLSYTRFTVTSNNYAEDRNCLRELVADTSLSLSLSKLSMSLESETSDCVSAYNSHKMSSSCRTFLCKAMVATEGKWSVSEWVAPLLQSWSVCLYVTWYPRVLHQ
jgi:hypothetical protein